MLRLFLPKIFGLMPNLKSRVTSRLVPYLPQSSFEWPSDRLELCSQLSLDRRPWPAAILEKGFESMEG